MDSAAARVMCKREVVGKFKSLEAQTLWLQHVVRAKTLTLKTVKSQDNCADLGSKTLAAGTLSRLRNLNGLVDKNGMDNVPCGVRAVTISGESRKLGATALNVLDRTLEKIARNDQIVSGGENVFGSLVPEQLYAVCSNSLQVGADRSHHDVGVETVVENLVVHAHLPRLLSCLRYYSD